MFITALTLLLITGSPDTEQPDDPKIARLLKDVGLYKGDEGAPKKLTRYPSLQVGYQYGGAFGLTQPQGEHTIGIYAWPWQHFWRLGLGIELGILSRDPGGHLGLSLSFGYQQHFPFHWYADLVLMGGIYRVNLYQAEVLSPISKVGVHTGVGFNLARFHGTVGLLVEKIDLFLSSGTLSGVSFGVEVRVGF